MSRIFLTGGTGFIGRHLTGLLLDQGYEVILLMHHRNYTGKSHPNLTLVRGDIREPKSWENSLKTCDAVIHLAGSVSETSLYRYIRHNSEPTRILAEATDTPFRNTSWQIRSVITGNPSSWGKAAFSFPPGIFKKWSSVRLPYMAREIEAF